MRNCSRWAGATTTFIPANMGWRPICSWRPAKAMWYPREGRHPKSKSKGKGQKAKCKLAERPRVAFRTKLAAEKPGRAENSVSLSEGRVWTAPRAFTSGRGTGCDSNQRQEIGRVGM